MINKYPTLNYKGLEKRFSNNLKIAVKEVKEYTKKFGEENFENYYETKSYKKLNKKIQKAIYLKDKFSTFEQFDSEHLINAFRQQDDYDSWLDVYIFNTNNKETIENELYNMFVEVEGSSWTSDYDCTGRAFYRPCRFFQLEDRTFVLQSGGLDV